MKPINKEVLIDIIRRYEQANFFVERRLNALFKEIMPEELTVDQLMMIRYIRNRERATTSELADNFLVGKSSITAIITRLVDKDFIIRIPDDKDRRVIYLTLTKKGMDLADDMELKIHDVLAKYLSLFDEEEGKAFIQTFEKLAAVLSENEHE